MNTILLAALAAVASAMPSYIAVPADQIAFLDLREMRARRVPRQTLTPPQPQASYSQDYQHVPLHPYQQHTVAFAPAAAPEGAAPARLTRVQAAPDNAGAPSQGAISQYAERPPDFGEYVDFGAHTGDHGAFGWYADYPVNNQESSSSY